MLVLVSGSHCPQARLYEQEPNCSSTIQRERFMSVDERSSENVCGTLDCTRVIMDDVSVRSTTLIS
jgi:hypothetical protein